MVLPDPDTLVRGTELPRIRILPFSRKGVERTKIVLAKLNFYKTFLAKNSILIIKPSWKLLIFIY
jgi:hypothetical protein